MKRILFSFPIIAAVAFLAFGASRAFFSDTEKSLGNTLQAGAIDLKIDNTSYYNGATSSATSWVLKDLTPNDLFFNFTDIKPGDLGEDTVSLHVDTNDAWVCANIDITKNDDVSSTEPELLDGDTQENTGDNFDGELAQNLNFVFWSDDGDNVLESGEEVLTQGPASSIFGEVTWTIADSLTNNTLNGVSGEPLAGNTTYYIGKAWCFGNLTLTPLVQDGVGDARTPIGPEGPGLSCNGSLLNNITQSDLLMGDISFSAVQSRNNPNFLCSGEQPSGTPTPTVTPTPTPLACNQADVMLVLDRSGSISSTELGQLKTASKDFVDALGLSTTGIHAGKSSFATTGSLNHHLTDDPVSLKAAIDAMVSSGFTNLKEGIDLANTELGGGDGHDRTDGSSPDKMIVITDGHPNRPLPSNTADDLAATSADNARGAGVEVFVVGVGGDVNTSYLQTEIADSAGHYYAVSDYNGLKTTLQNLDLCN